MAKEVKVKMNNWFRGIMSKKAYKPMPKPKELLHLHELIVYTYKTLEKQHHHVSYKYTDVVCVYKKAGEVRYIILNDLVSQLSYSGMPTVNSVTAVKRGEIITYKRVTHTNTVERSDGSFFENLEELNISFMLINDVTDGCLRQMLGAA